MCHIIIFKLKQTLYIYLHLKFKKKNKLMTKLQASSLKSTVSNYSSQTVEIILDLYVK